MSAASYTSSGCATGPRRLSLPMSRAWSGQARLSRCGDRPGGLGRVGSWLVWLVRTGRGVRGLRRQRRAPVDECEAVVQCLPDSAEAGTDRQVTADGVSRLGLVSKRIEHGPAQANDHRVGCLDRELPVGYADQHLAPAGFLCRLIAGTRALSRP